MRIAATRHSGRLSQWVDSGCNETHGLHIMRRAPDLRIAAMGSWVDVMKLMGYILDVQDVAIRTKIHFVFEH